MTLNKNALKEVGIMWLIIAGIFAYAAVIATLTLYASPWFFAGGMLLILIPSFSYMVYQSAVMSDKAKQEQANIRRLKRRRRRN